MASNDNMKPAYHVTCDVIKPWDRYIKEDLKSRVKGKFPYPARSDLNRKVALWFGDVTHLAVDAIVNSAAKAKNGGQVNKAIMTKAGEAYKKETEKTIGKPGEVVVLDGYDLPCKHVINTFAPNKSQGLILRDCYLNCLNTAKDNGIRSVAFPCLATRKKHAFPKADAAATALETVRYWMTQNHKSMEIVVFCVYEKEDLALYEERMQVFFPEDEEGDGKDGDGDSKGSQDYDVKDEEATYISTDTHKEQNDISHGNEQHKNNGENGDKGYLQERKDQPEDESSSDVTDNGLPDNLSGSSAAIFESEESVPTDLQDPEHGILPVKQDINNTNNTITETTGDDNVVPRGQYNSSDKRVTTDNPVDTVPRVTQPQQPSDSRKSHVQMLIGRFNQNS